MKVLWSSNAPWASSGYGVQTEMFTRRIRDAGHDVAILAFYGLEGSIMHWDGMTVYPTDHTRLGKQMIRPYAEHHAGDTPVEDMLIITLMDVWTMIDLRFGGKADVDGLRMASWTPVDHDPLPPKVAYGLSEMKSRPIAMSRFGETQLRQAGFDPLYVPHGVDTAVYKPLENRRELLSTMKIPDDAFVVGMVANNQGSGPPRKAFPQVFQAFAEFHQRHPDTFLYLHSDVYGYADGINLVALADIVGIPREAIGATDQFKLHIGVEPEQMAGIYNGFDVLCSPSYGEGFGVPIVEAQACGVPVIVTDWTAMPELCGAGWKVQGDAWYDSAHGSFFMCPAVMEIVDALEAAYQARGDQALRDQAREFALAYDVDRVMHDYWLPTLAALEPAPKPNRAQRRAKTKVAA